VISGAALPAVLCTVLLAVFDPAKKIEKVVDGIKRKA
jgi:hypothetical protein